MNDLDLQFMERALELAAQGEGFVEPNPMVGSVLAKDGAIVGEGWHQKFGGPHAEIHALAAAGDRARGATLYVTLEPCAHHGKTPPCTEAIIRAGITRVVAGLQDPFPQVAGAGVTQLRNAGIDVEVGVGEQGARDLLAPYLRRVTSGKPWVIAKWAMTLDGKIATAARESKWITGEEARAHAHKIRGRVDAILVGIGTVLADDPLLTTRPPGPRVATRIVLDSQLRTPSGSRLVKSAREVPVLVVHDPKAERSRIEQLQQAGCECWSGAATDQLGSLLHELGAQRSFTNLMVEGGSAVLGSFLKAGLIDEVYAYIAPKLLGGRAAPGPIGGAGTQYLTDALQLDAIQLERLGEDLLLRARVTRPAS